MSASPLLDIQDLSVHFRRRRSTVTALDGVSLSIGAGEAVGLVGESGSGKSTLARAVLGLVPASAGTVRFDGEDITRLSFQRRRPLYRRMQMVFQDPYSSLDPRFTIGEILAEPMRSFGERDGQIQARAKELLARVRLPPEVLDRRPRAFSGGQRQRIAIVRALMCGPELVICDEAVSALDLSVQAQIVNLLRELAHEDGLAYLFVSHDLDLVRHLCQRTVVLYRGRVMEAGETARVASAPAHPYTQALVDAAPVPDPSLQRERRARSAAGAVATGAGAEPGADACAFAPRCPYAEPRCVSERPTPGDATNGGTVACHRDGVWQEDAGAATVPRAARER